MQVKTLQQSTRQEDPQDLMSIKELCLKHAYNYDYLYKWSILEGVITVYDRGSWKLSESEVLEFSRQQGAKKLNKVRNTKEVKGSGWHKQS